MSEEKNWVESHPDRTILETIYQTQIIILGRLATLQREVDQIKATVNNQRLEETGLPSSDTLFETVADLETELNSLDDVQINFPFKQIRSRD